MLSSIGERPVSSLSSGLVDAEMAETILNSVDRDVQGMGWWFNRDVARKFTPDDTSGEVQFPYNTLKSDFVKESTYKDLVQRGFRVYDAYNHTYDIGSNYAQVYVDLIIQLDFDDVPEVGKRYIGLKAARVFQDRTTGATDLHGFQQEDEFMAFADLKDTEGENGEHNIFQDYGVYSIVDRNPGGGAQRLRLGY
jgi:hypothetical protein